MALIHRDTDRSRLRDRSRCPGHGDRVVPCRCSGNAVVAAAIAAAATDETHGEECKQHKRAKHRPPAPPVRRNAEEYEAGQRSATGCVPGSFA